MAYAAPPPAPAPRVRPGTVNLAVILLYVAAACEVISAIIAIATYGDFKDAYEKAYAGTSLAGKAGSATATVIVTAVIALVLAAIFVVLAILDGNGNRVARILTWVLGGLALCCTGSSFALTAVGKSAYDTNRKNNPDLPSYDQLQHSINAELPSWYSAVTLTLGILVLLSVLLVIVLLALPASHPYFRKPAPPQWEPPGYVAPPEQSPGYLTPPEQPALPPDDPAGPVPPNPPSS